MAKRSGPFRAEAPGAVGEAAGADPIVQMWDQFGEGLRGRRAGGAERVAPTQQAARGGGGARAGRLMSLAGIDRLLADAWTRAPCTLSVTAGTEHFAL